MPEAAVDEDADASARPNNVGASGPLQTKVKPVASEAVLLEKGAQPQLRCCVPPPDSRHRVRAATASGRNLMVLIGRVLICRGLLGRGLVNYSSLTSTGEGRGPPA